MQNFQEIQEQAFRDVKDIIEGLQSINSPDEFKNRRRQIVALQELLTFLDVSARYQNPVGQAPVQHAEIQGEDTTFNMGSGRATEDKYSAEEEVIFNNSLNQIENSEIDYPEIGSDVLEEEAAFNNHLNEIETPVLPEEDEIFGPDVIEGNREHADYEETPPIAIVKENYMDAEKEEIDAIDEPDTQDGELPATRGKIIDFEREEKMQELNEAAALIQEQHEEKKLRLAHIKGLKKIQSFFEEDPLEELKEKEEKHNEPQAGSLLKSNVRTDFMEAEKPKNEFKLDLNDKIAFSKMLFEGSETKMNETINTLNSFKTLEEAKEFLSEAYYKYHWEKSDEYAQRLWSLVENKFL